MFIIRSVFEINIKYRIKFTKKDKMIYIGHLDLLKVTQRAIKRAGLPIAYSQGFNPHQQTSFALPLSLGVTGLSEYLDIQLVKEIEEEEILKSLNESFVEGIEILQVRKLREGEKNSASIVERGTYEVFTPDLQNIESLIEKLMGQDEILVEKKTKKKTFKTTDVKEDIFEIKKSEQNENSVFLNIATGSKKNLKPELVIEQLYKLAEVPFDKLNIKITRTGMLKEVNGEYVDLIC